MLVTSKALQLLLASVLGGLAGFIGSASVLSAQGDGVISERTLIPLGASVAIGLAAVALAFRAGRLYERYEWRWNSRQRKERGK